MKSAPANEETVWNAPTNMTSNMVRLYHSSRGPMCKNTWAAKQYEIKSR